MRFILRTCVFVLLAFASGAVQLCAQVRLAPAEAEKMVIEAPVVVYPTIAKAVHAKGLVEVEITVSEQGTVTSAKAISGHPLLQPAAVSAVRKRVYQPYLVANKPVTFISVVDVLFPTGTLTSEQRREYKRQKQLAAEYYEENKNCRELAKSHDLKAAENACSVVLRIAVQLEDDRYMEKMSANEFLGHVLLRQKRYSDAIEYYNRALAVVANRLTEKDAELGQLWGDLAIAHHLMRELDKAREFYKRAEKIYQTAYATFGDGDTDEFIQTTKQEYLKALKTLLEYHLSAAEDAGALSETEELRKLIKSLKG